MDVEDGLDLALEGEVHGLGGEVTDDAGHVTAPEGLDALLGQCTLGAVDDVFVWTVKTTLLDHLTLVLDQELDTLDGGGGGLGNASNDAREHESSTKFNLPPMLIYLKMFYVISRSTLAQS